MNIPEPLRVLVMFGMGLDTLEIAERLGRPEIARLLESGFDITWAERQRAQQEDPDLRPAE